MSGQAVTPREQRSSRCGTGIALVMALLGTLAPAQDLFAAEFEAACSASDLRPAPITPLPHPAGLDDPVVRLGRFLFHSPALSRDGTVACSSCHDLASGGDDGRISSVGIDGHVGPINAPSVLNRAFDFRMFWDGRAEDLLEQADGPLQHPGEMDSSWPIAIANLRGNRAFEIAFRAAYSGEEINGDRLRAALVAYEEQLLTPGSDFDRYLCGEDDALSPEARAGFERFVALGCVSCHQGTNVGGNLFQLFGVFESPFEAEGRELTEADLGRFNVTGDPADRHVFKVPSLRNVEVTGPYFHDGSASSLEEAIRVMGRSQLGRSLIDEDVRGIAAFLRSLTGALPTGARP